jgi:hypothetical protein
MDSTTGTSTFMELIRNVVKYLILGLVIAFAAYYIPQRTMQLREILMIGATTAITFAVLDYFTPSIGEATRTGAGLGIGATMVGFPALL